jgi:hypothetical protein
MRANVSLLPAAFGLLCAVVMAQEQPAVVSSPGSANNTIYITHVTVIDTETGREDRDRTVIISRGRILQVRARKGGRPSMGTKVVDGTGKYLILSLPKSPFILKSLHLQRRDV